MRQRIHSHLAVAALIVLFLISGTTAAVAFWTTAGSGAVTATVGTPAPVGVVALSGETPGTAMVPGGPAANLVLKIDNANAFAVSLAGVALAGGITAENGCSSTGVTLSAPTNLPITLAPGVSVIHLAGAASMDQTVASACQGSSFSFPLNLTVLR
jgi:hypothetical protein